MVDKIKIGNFLRQLRTEKEMTQEDLAEKFGVSSRSVSRWENGNTMPDLGILVELADYYDIDLRELVNGERKSENMNNEIKDVLKSAASYAELEKKQVVRRKCIVTFVGTLCFVLCVLIGTTVLPTLPDTIKKNVNMLFLVIGLAGLIGLWLIVIYQNRKNKKNG